MLTAFSQFKCYLIEEKIASPLTVKSYEMDCLKLHRFLCAKCHSIEMQSISPEDIRSYLHSLVEAGLSNATVRRAMYSLRSFFSWAHKWEVINKNQFYKITIPKKAKEGRVRFLCQKEKERILNAAKEFSIFPYSSKHQAYLLIYLLLTTGIRRAELLSLNWDDVDFLKREITIKRGKGGKLRVIPLEDKELLALLNQKRRYDEAKKNDPVFRTKNSTRMTKSSFNLLMRKIIAHANLQDVSAHTLRHTFATVLCDRGVSLPTVKLLLGHANIDSTMIYVHPTTDALRAAVKKLQDSK